jgi:hypothetical protein
MESESYREKTHKKKISDVKLSPSNVLQSVGVRRSVRSDNEMDRVLLDYGFNFLLPFGIFLWIVFLVITNI